MRVAHLAIAASALLTRGDGNPVSKHVPALAQPSSLRRWSSNRMKESTGRGGARS